MFIASCDKAARCWDLSSNQVIQVAAHDAPIKTCHWIKGAYSCLMTGSWDKTLKVKSCSRFDLFHLYLRQLIKIIMLLSFGI